MKKLNTPLILLVAFLTIPRMANMIPINLRDYFVAGHNIIRFGTLCIAAYLLIMNRIENINNSDVQ